MNEKIQKYLAELEKDYHKGNPIPFNNSREAVKHLMERFGMSFGEMIGTIIALHPDTRNSIVSLITLANSANLDS